MDARVVVAGDVGYFKGGSGFPTRFQGLKRGDIPFFKVSDMNNPGNELFMRRSNNYISEATRKRLGAVRIPAGAIVFAKVGAAVFLERKRILAQDSCIDNNMAAFIVDPSEVDVRFAHYLLCDFKMASMVATTALPSLNSSQLRSIPFRLPAIAEQRRIANALDASDELIASCEQAISKKRAIKEGLLQELLTGRTRLQGFRSEWAPVTLGAAGSTYGGLVGKSGKDFGYGRGRFVTFVEVMRDVRLRGVELAQVVMKRGEHQNEVRRGDVLFNGSSETPEEVALAAAVEFDEPGVLLNSFCFGYRLSRFDVIDPLFLAYYFRATPGRDLIVSLAQGSTRYNIAKTKLIRAVLTLPGLAEQKAIAAVLRDADADIEALERRLESTRAIKQGMMQELLTGRTRLVGEGAA